MDLLSLLDLDGLSHGLAGLSMFPYFDVAHYAVSVMALREQPGVVEVSRKSPFACWFSSMLFCFGGALLSGFMLAEPLIAPLSNSTNLLIASLVWYLVFYCPEDLVYSIATILPVRLVLTAMKEVTRTWKVVGGVTHAHSKFRDSLVVMVAVGWAKGAGGGLISNFEQLARGVWKPETNELLKMSYPTKITLVGAVLFGLQQSQYLPVQKHHLMLLYTVFTVVVKMRMMLTGSYSSPFAPIESAIYQRLFADPSPHTGAAETSAPLPGKDKDSTAAMDPPGKEKDSTTAPPEANGTESCKKTD